MNSLGDTSEAGLSSCFWVPRVALSYVAALLKLAN